MAIFSHHFSTTQQICQNVTLKENWLIKWNVRVDLLKKGTICWRHREHYGSKFRIRLSKCMYPGHIESKRKLTVMPMSLPAVLQTERLLSSAIIKVILLFGASILVYQLHGLASSIQLVKVLKAPWNYVEFAIRNIMMLAGITNLEYTVTLNFTFVNLII